MHKFVVPGKVYRIVVETVSSTVMGDRRHWQFEVPIDGDPIVVLSEDCPCEVILREPFMGYEEPVLNKKLFAGGSMMRNLLLFWIALGIFWCALEMEKIRHEVVLIELNEHVLMERR